jgi:endoribonuclease Dicer
MACAAFLFKAHPEADPAQLTEYKALMTSKKFRGALSVILGFDKRVCMGASQLGPRIDKYSRSLFLARKASDKLNFWLNPSIMSPPKILHEVLDAFISAIYFDSEYNYGLVEGFFNSYILPYFMDMSLYEDFLFSAVPHVIFARKLAKIGCQQWSWEMGTDRTRDRPKHLEAILIHGVVFTSCSTRNVNLARERVAVAALKKLESLSPVELRRLCNCPKSHQDGEHAEAEARRKRIKIEE